MRPANKWLGLHSLALPRAHRLRLRLALRARGGGEREREGLRLTEAFLPTGEREMERLRLQACCRGRALQGVCVCSIVGRASHIKAACTCMGRCMLTSGPGAWRMPLPCDLFPVCACPPPILELI